MRLAVVAAAALILPHPAYAEVDTNTGNGLLALCSDDQNVAAASLCSGYIVGAADMADLLVAYCPPQKVTNRQLRDIVLSGLRNDPANRHLFTPVLIVKYLSSAFPCRK